MKIMLRLISSIAISMAALAPFSVHAFGLPSIPGLDSKSSNTGSVDLTGAQDQLVKQYATAGKFVLQGNASMADALGLTSQASAARAAGDSLNDGATKGSLSDADKANSDTNTAITEKLKNPVELDAPAKAKFAAGIVQLAQGMVKYVGMKGSFQSFSSSLSSASPMMLPKLQSGAYIVSTLPSSIKNLSSALNSAVAYAKAHDIALPKEATDAL